MGQDDNHHAHNLFGFNDEMAEFQHERRRKPPPKNDRVRTYLRLLIKENGVELKDLSVFVGKNPSYFSSYLRGEPQELPEEVRDRLAEFFKLDNPSVFRSDGADGPNAQPTTFGYRFRYRLGHNAAPVPDAEQFTYPAPPLWNGPRRGILAQVADDHADRLYPAGAMLWACALDQLGRPLRTGDRVLVRIPDMTEQYRVMLVSLSADAHDVIVQSSTNVRALVASYTLPRPNPAGTADAIDYRAHPDDPAEIIAVVVASVARPF